MDGKSEIGSIWKDDTVGVGEGGWTMNEGLIDWEGVSAVEWTLEIDSL